MEEEEEEEEEEEKEFLSPTYPFAEPRVIRMRGSISSVKIVTRIKPMRSLLSILSNFFANRFGFRELILSR